MSEDRGFQYVDSIRGRLRNRIEIIERIGHGATYGGWVGDVANARAGRDDLLSGRTYWEQAWRNATNGLDALDNGNANYALALLLFADEMMLAALMARLRPDDLHQLAKPAKRRGRPKRS